jgi:outer membrane protein OmpA-like peptidoglycan-associated protein
MGTESDKPRSATAGPSRTLGSYPIRPLISRNSRSQANPPLTTALPPAPGNIPALAPGETQGRRLEPVLQRDLGPRLQADLSAVRIHTGAGVAESVAALNARAYTVGPDIMFGAGQFDPSSNSGRELLIHELAHTAQPQGTSTRSVSQPHDASEREADQVAETVMQGGIAAPRVTPAASVQREPLEDSKPTAYPSVLDRMLDKASPFLAAAVGSATLEGFDTGKSDLKPQHHAQLKQAAGRIEILLHQYPQSQITVTGHTDTVGTEARNDELGLERANTVAAALRESGVPPATLIVKSAGESAPQAVKTADQTPNAHNRRVQVDFDPKAPLQTSPAPQLEQQSPVQPVRPLFPPPVDLQPHRHIEPPDPKQVDPDFWKPIPPAPRGSGPKSPLDVISEALIDPIVDGVTHPLGLSRDKRQWLKERARDAVKAGIPKLARQAAQSAGVQDQQALDAIEKATEAAIQTKGAGPPTTPP